MKDYKWEERGLAFMLEDKAVRLKERTFLYFRDEKVSYADLNKASNRVAHSLTKMGMKKDDKVAIMLMNVPEYIYFWFGAAKLGVVEVPINVAYKGDLLQYIVNNSEASVMLVDKQFMDRIEFIGDGFENLKHVIVYPEWSGPKPKARFDVISYKDFLGSDESNPANAGIVPSDPMAIMYTSGTTGPSKGVIHSHGTYHAYAAGQIKYAKLTESDVLYAAMPYFHTSSQALSTYAAFVGDASVVMAEKFSVKKFWEEMRKYNCTFCLAVGAMFNFLGAALEAPGDADNPLRVFNGGPFPAKRVEAFEKRFGVKCLELYGNVESGCMTRSPYDAHRPGSCGKAADEYEVRIVDEYDNPVPAGQVGEFVCRTKEPWTFMSGYYKMPDKTADAFRNLWLHTGGRRQDGRGRVLLLCGSHKGCHAKERGEHLIL